MITAAICTYRRNDLLVDAVRSLATQTLSPVQYEVLVVDNACSKDTEAILASVDPRPEQLRYVGEERLGLSHARNRALAEARSPVVAFMDDDATASTDWLAAHANAFASGTAICGSGGPIRLVWPTTRPEWLPTESDSYFSALDLGSARRPLIFPEHPYGTNMAVDRAAVLAVGGFSSRFGRKGASLLSMEEGELFWRLEQRGLTVLYEPAALVHHRVMPDRISRRWLLRRAYQDGRSQALFDELVAFSAVPAGPRAVARASAHAIAHALKFLRPGPSTRTRQHRMGHLANAARWAGVAKESLRTSSSE